MAYYLPGKPETQSLYLRLASRRVRRLDRSEGKLIGQNAILCLDDRNDDAVALARTMFASVTAMPKVSVYRPGFEGSVKHWFIYQCHDFKGYDPKPISRRILEFGRPDLGDLLTLNCAIIRIELTVKFHHAIMNCMLSNDASRCRVALPLRTNRRVRTRFAPSPTGMLHLGALRTALFSYLAGAPLWRRLHVLRIEDTDQNRIIPGALESIIRSLRGMGIMYDEGPDKASVAALADSYGPVALDILPDFGGSYGPYFQSQRLPRYREVLEILLESARHTTPSRQKTSWTPNALWRTCVRSLTATADVIAISTWQWRAARVADGAGHVIRFKNADQGHH